MSSSQEKPVYSDSDSSSDSGTKAQYGMTRKKLELYRKQVRESEDTVLEFEELDMATYQIVAGILFRLTFKAKNIAKGGESLTYQAIVLKGIDEQNEVLSFRRKPSGSQKEEWIFQNQS